MKRALAVTDSDRLNFFRLYDGTLTDVAVLSWCKLFGSEREALHWSRLLPKSSAVLQPSLEDELSKASGGDLDGLSNNIRNYRDSYVAHHDLNEGKRAQNHPALSPLQETGQVLYATVYRTLAEFNKTFRLPDPDRITGLNLERVEIAWREIGEAARAATAGFREPQ